MDRRAQWTVVHRIKRVGHNLATEPPPPCIFSHEMAMLNTGLNLVSSVQSFSCVSLFATPWTATYQAPLSMGFSRQEHWSGVPFPSPMHESGKGKGSCSVMSDSLQPHGLQPTRLLCPWDFPGKSTGVGCLLWFKNEPFLVQHVDLCTAGSMTPFGATPSGLALQGGC